MLVIFHNHNNKSYYYKMLKGTYKTYKVGDFNQYNHEVVLIIEDVYFYKVQKLPLKSRVIKKITSFLQKLD